MLLQFLEQNSQKNDEKGMVSEWGVSHTTLEEVFLNITKKYNFVYKDQDQQSLKDFTGFRVCFIWSF